MDMVPSLDGREGLKFGSGVGEKIDNWNMSGSNARARQRT